MVFDIKINRKRKGVYIIMTHRISISIPDELQERIKQYKGELNVSKICQKALIAATDRIEKKKSSAQEYGDIVERLRDEYIKEYKDEIENEAMTDALYDVDKVSIETVKEFIKDPWEFQGADPEALFNLYGKYRGDCPAFDESLLLRSIYYKNWAMFFCDGLDNIERDFQQAINEVDE